MINLLLSIAFIIITSFVGLNIILLFDKNMRLGSIAILGLSYLFGLGAITIEMFIMGMLKFRFSITAILLPWLVLCILNVKGYKQYLKEATKRLRFSFNLKWNEWLLAGLLIIVIGYTFFKAMIKPIEAYDSVAIWALKSKIIYLAHSLPESFFNYIDANFHGIHADYPLLLPFSEVWFYTFIGRFDDYLVKALFPINSVAFTMVFYSFLLKIIKDRGQSLFFAFVLISIGIFNKYATIGYADLEMTIYASVAFVSFYIWTRVNDAAYFLAAIFSTILAFWTKNEGAVSLTTMIFLIILFLINKIKKVKLTPDTALKLITASILLCLIFLGWALFKQGSALQNDIITNSTFKQFNLVTAIKRIVPILYEYQKNIFGIKYWNLIWLIFICLFIIKVKYIFLDRYKYIVLPILITLSAYTAIYMITPNDIVWQLDRSLERLLLHILPLVVFYVSLAVNENLSHPPKISPALDNSKI